MPPQNTRLGGSIRIHGGGAGKDWTLGCMAMADEDIAQLYAELPGANALIEVYRGRQQDSILNRPGLVNEAVVAGAKNLFGDSCNYTASATGIIAMSYPFGDISRDIGVCTDVIIRALRPLGMDLQALLHEDILRNPRRYPAITRPNSNIDHRRTRNLKIWFDHHALKLTNTPPAEDPQSWQPGDIVIMDTGVDNGTAYDHIGITSDDTKAGRPLVINLWTIGYMLEQMDLLDGSYPGIAGHYRMLHPFDYDAMPLR